MSSISAIASAATQRYQAQAPRTTDADGDSDGSKTASTPQATAPVTPQPQVSKPTATMGNNVNTMA